MKFESFEQKLCLEEVLNALDSSNASPNRLCWRSFLRACARLFGGDCTAETRSSITVTWNSTTTDAGPRGGKVAVPLTSKEFALLELFLLHAPDLVTRSEIVEHVSDRHFDSETNFVEVYVNRLRQKIDQNQPVKLIHTVRGIGYRLGAVEP